MGNTEFTDQNIIATVDHVADRPCMDPRLQRYNCVRARQGAPQSVPRIMNANSMTTQFYDPCYICGRNAMFEKPAKYVERSALTAFHTPEWKGDFKLYRDTIAYSEPKMLYDDGTVNSVEIDTDSKLRDGCYITNRGIDNATVMDTTYKFALPQQSCKTPPQYNAKLLNTARYIRTPAREQGMGEGSPDIGSYIRNGITTRSAGEKAWQGETKFTFNYQFKDMQHPGHIIEMDGLRPNGIPTVRGGFDTREVDKYCRRNRMWTNIPNKVV